MSLLDYADIIWRRGWIVILGAVLAAVAAYAFSSVMTPVYQSTTVVLIQPSRNDFGLTEATTRLLRSYVAYLDSDFRAQEVIDALKLDMTPGGLRADVTIESDESRLTIQIVVRNQNGDLANDIGRTWAELLVQWRIEQNQKVQRSDRIEAMMADFPHYGLFSPQKSINTAVGAALGAVLGLAVVFVLEFLEAGVMRAPADLESLGLPVLGVIPRHKE